MLAGLLFNVDPGSHRFIIMMTLTGLAPVIIVNAALMSERPIWVISCLMIFYGQALSRMDEISSLNWQENAIVKSCGVRFVALLQVH